MDMQGFDPSAGTYVKGIRVRNEVFLAVTHFDQLKTFARDPELLQASSRRRGYGEDIEDEVEVHDLIQRALSGNKKSNVPRYRDYIGDVVDGVVGVLPPMHLWSEQSLDVVLVSGNPFLVVPYGSHLLAIDGETQLAGHFQLLRSAACRAAGREDDSHPGRQGVGRSLQESSGSVRHLERSEEEADVRPVRLLFGKRNARWRARTTCHARLSVS